MCNAEINTKVCSKCNIEKTFTEFHKSKSGKYGLRSDCKICSAEYKKNWYENNKERHLEYNKIWRENNKERHLKNSKIWYENNKNRCLESNKIWYENNRERYLESNKIWYENNRESHLESMKIWRETNSDKVRAINAKRRSKKLKATPVWLSEYDLNQIKSIYKEAIDLELKDGFKRHVDHIHPLQNKYICGLHVPQNLQILTETENCSKSNKFEPYVISDLDLNNLQPWQVQ